jgi:hypothetical protein
MMCLTRRPAITLFHHNQDRENESTVIQFKQSKILWQFHAGFFDNDLHVFYKHLAPENKIAHHS